MENLEDFLNRMNNDAKYLTNNISRLLFQNINDPAIIFNNSFEIVSLNNPAKVYIKKVFQEIPSNQCENSHLSCITLKNIIPQLDMLNQLSKICNELTQEKKKTNCLINRCPIEY